MIAAPGCGNGWLRICAAALAVCQLTACADGDHPAMHSGTVVDRPQRSAAGEANASPQSPPSPTGIQNPDSATAEADRVRYIQNAIHPPSDPVLRGHRNTRTATGFFVSETEIVTNYHTVEGCSRLSRTPDAPDARPTQVELAATDPVHDLALLTAAAPVSSPATFERRLHRVDGSDLSIVGFPTLGLPRQQAVISPAVAVPSELETDKALFRLNADVHPGNSGSPVLDEYGAVVGVISRRIDTVAVYRKTGALINDVAFAIPSAIVVTFLARHHVGFRTGEPAASLPAAERLAKSRSYLVRVDCWQ